MELRQLRYFIRVAETLHFGRAAEREHIAQSVVSAQISKLEQELGVALFERTSRRVSLTAAGEGFHPHALRAFAALESGATAARECVVEMQTLRVGAFTDDPLTHRILSAFRRRFPRVPISYVELSISDQVSRVVDGKVDISFVWLPVADRRVRLTPLYRESPVVAVSSTHVLATRSHVRVEDLFDESFAVAAVGTPPEWRAHWSLDAHRGGPPARHVEVSSARESLAAVAYGGVVDTMSTNSATFWPHPGVRFLPLAGATPSSLALVSAPRSRTPLVEAFLLVAGDVVQEEIATVPGAVSLVG